jgi:hypothetical protein
LQKCITNLEAAFDPLKARKRAPAVLALEAAIDKALSSAFGYGTPAYLQHNRAATLDPSPLLTNVTLQGAVLRPVGGPTHEGKAEETRRHFSENRQRSISLLRQAIGTLEEEIAAAEPVVLAEQRAKATPLEDAKSKATQSPEVGTLRPRRWGGVGLEAAWRRLGRWWQGHN